MIELRFSAVGMSAEIGIQHGGQFVRHNPYGPARISALKTNCIIDIRQEKIIREWFENCKNRSSDSYMTQPSVFCHFEHYFFGQKVGNAIHPYNLVIPSDPIEFLKVVLPVFHKFFVFDADVHQKRLAMVHTAQSIYGWSDSFCSALLASVELL